MIKRSVLLGSVSLIGCALALAGTATAEVEQMAQVNALEQPAKWCSGEKERVAKFQLRWRFDDVSDARAPLRAYEICQPHRAPVVAENRQSAPVVLAANVAPQMVVKADAAKSAPSVQVLSARSSQEPIIVKTSAARINSHLSPMGAQKQIVVPQKAGRAVKSVPKARREATPIHQVEPVSAPAIDEPLLEPGDRVLITFVRAAGPVMPLYLVQPGDTLSVSVDGVPELSISNSRVLPDGTVFVPQIGAVRMAGASVEDIVAYLEAQYRNLRIRQPKVKLTMNSINDRAAEFLDGLSGGSNSAGPTFTVTVPRTEYVSLPFVGEFDPFSPLPVWRKTIRDAVLREFGGALEVVINVERISSEKIFVIGEVARPSDINLSVADNAFSAVAAAGGFLKTAARDRLLIVRTGTSGAREIIPLNLKKLVLGREEQPALDLMPEDILIVPPTRIAQSNTAVEKYVKNLLPFDVNLGFGVDFRND